MSTLFSFGLGSAYPNAQGDYLDTFYPQPLINASDAIAKAAESVGYTGGNATLALTVEQLDTLADALNNAGEAEQAQIAQSLKASQQAVVATVLASDEKPNTTPEAYLKLHLLSHRLVKPHGTVLDGFLP